MVNSKDDVEFAMSFTALGFAFSYDPTGREGRRTSDPSLSRDRGPADSRDSFTLDALVLKPSGFCNVGINLRFLGYPAT